MLLALAACRGGRDDPAPFAESRTPPLLSGRFFPPDGWTWGFLQLGEGPVQRYGVSAPSVRPSAEVLILPDYGETAETWFETARDLNDRGYTVWVLEAQGQGGSQRTASQRDLGHILSFGSDVAAVGAMIRSVIRPAKPIVLIGHGVGGLIATRAVQTGVTPDGLILISPTYSLPGRRGARVLKAVGLGARRAPGAVGWSRRANIDEQITHDPWRGRVTELWQGANPDLRMGGPSLDWVSAFDETAKAARLDLPSIGVATLVLEGERAEGCQALRACRAVRWRRAGAALELERNAVRSQWLEAVDSFIRSRLPPSPGA